MPGTAVVISGVPAKTLQRVMQRLNRDFNPGYVFRGRGAPLSAQRVATYSREVVDAAIADATDAIFGTTQRAVSFCRNISQPCVSRGARGKTCGRKQGQSCGLERPDRLLLLFQEGRDEQSLTKAFYHSALTRRISAAAYGDADETAEEIAGTIRNTKGQLAFIESEFTSRRTPLLLPPRAFRTSGAVPKLLIEANAIQDPSRLVMQFRIAHWKQDGHVFCSDQDLHFKAEEKHGIAGNLSQAFALSATYRLGCAIAPGFHWNVSPADGSSFKGRAFDCREEGAIKVSASHVNFFADDRIR